MTLETTVAIQILLDTYSKENVNSVFGMLKLLAMFVHIIKMETKRERHVIIL